jgi:hypothetical protein
MLTGVKRVREVESSLVPQWVYDLEVETIELVKELKLGNKLVEETIIKNRATIFEQVFPLKHPGRYTDMSLFQSIMDFYFAQSELNDPHH